MIDQGTKSKRIGAKSAKDFAEKNLGDLFRAPHLRVSLKPYEKTTKETDGLIWEAETTPKEFSSFLNQ